MHIKMSFYINKLVNGHNAVSSRSSVPFPFVLRQLEVIELNKCNCLILNVRNINRKSDRDSGTVWNSHIWLKQSETMHQRNAHDDQSLPKLNSLKSRRCWWPLLKNNILFSFTFVCIVCDQLHFNLVRSIHFSLAFVSTFFFLF